MQLLLNKRELGFYTIFKFFSWKIVSEQSHTLIYMLMDLWQLIINDYGVAQVAEKRHPQLDLS